MYITVDRQKTDRNYLLGYVILTGLNNNVLKIPVTSQAAR